MYALHNHIKNWSKSQFLKYAVNESHGQGETVVTPSKTQNPDPWVSINIAIL